MTLIESILIGLLQGITEFLPVSSSGHIVLAKSLLGIRTPGALWETAFHLGSLVAVLAVFSRELRDIVTAFCAGLVRTGRGTPSKKPGSEDPNFRLALCIIIGTIPAVIVGLAFGRFIETLFAKPILTAFMLFATGEILWVSRAHSQMRLQGDIRPADGIWVGIAQAAAMIPGISRSGATISAGLARGVGRDTAARFSFLLAVPAILGAGILKARHITALPGDQVLPLVAGAAVAAVSGYVALRLLLRLVRAGKLHWFAYYCWALSLVAIAWLWSGILAPR